MNREPWSGCHQVSEGCANCYYYGPQGKRYGQNRVEKTANFGRPLARTAKGSYTIPGGSTVVTCFATDFFMPEADEWRKEAWAMIRERPDLKFLILTKRIDRFLISLPADWGEGYDNVNIGCSIENQPRADYRLPLFLSYPLKRRFVARSPLLEPVDLSFYLEGIDHVTVSGESGREARICDYDWVLFIREQCLKAGVTFWFKSTGSLFKRGGGVQRVNPCKQGSLARDLGINICHK